MNRIDQHSSLLSLRNSLKPDSMQLDGRDLVDRLSFLSNYSTLINFYSHQNKVESDWSFFLMKDPLFLLANIAKTDAEGIRKVFDASLLSLEKTIARKAENETTLDEAQLVCQLLDQLLDVYVTIDLWTIYMKKYDHKYALRKYLFKQIKQKYGLFLWSVLEFRTFIYIHASTLFPEEKSTPKADQIKKVRSYLFDDLDPKVWNENENNRPFWEVFSFGIHQNDDESPRKKLSGILKNNLPVVFAAVKELGQEIMNFLFTLVHEASYEFNDSENRKSTFPDTVLLRSFSELMQIHQHDLNALTAKHLSLYYKDILKQQKRTAIADKVYASLELSDKSKEIEINQNTLFKAGQNAANQPVFFQPIKQSFAYPVSVPMAYTLKLDTNAQGWQSLYLNTVPTPSVIKKDKKGKLLYWDTFGKKSANGKPSAMGLAVGSPMFYLEEGVRTIVISAGIENNLSAVEALSLKDRFKKAMVYLSTAKGWLKVNQKTNAFSVNQTSEALKVQFTITLKETDAAIVPLTKNPDGYTSDWPLLKLQFTQFKDLAKPLLIKTLDIDVSVKGVTKLELYNDYGKLNLKKPYQPFGPEPQANSNFYLGSKEVFSKPVRNMDLSLTWASLPQKNDFEDYYSAYNKYIAKYGATQKSVADSPILTPHQKRKKEWEKWWQDLKPILKKEENKIPIIKEVSWLVKGIKYLKSKFKRKEDKPVVKTKGSSGVVIFKEVSTAYFNNLSFKTSFNLLESSQWKALSFQKTSSEIINKSQVFTPYKKDTSCKIYKSDLTEKGLTLFSTDQKTCSLTTKSSFSCQLTPKLIIPGKPIVLPEYSAINSPDAALQSKLLIFNEKTESGFLSMELSGPSEGFGKELYPKVITYAALENAETLMEIKGDKDGENEVTDTTNDDTGGNSSSTKFAEMANSPFTPTLKSVGLCYEASVHYDLSTTGEYPIECFSYTPFQAAKVYDNTLDKASIQQLTAYDLSKTEAQSPKSDSSSEALKGVPLYLPFSAQGTLFIAIEQLKGNEALNLYFQLAPKNTTITSKQTIDYCCSAENGWSNASVLSDSTSGFKCSGILSLGIPEKISSDSTFMPGQNAWLSLSVNTNSDDFAGTVYLNTNGVELERSGTDYLSDRSAPTIAANTISGLKNNIVGLTKVNQPFSSFGGRKAEDTSEMNERVSQRISTKGRAVTVSDYYQLIQQEFPEVYYSAVSFCKRKKQTKVCLVKKLSDFTEVQAFEPFVPECDKLAVSQFLKDKTAAFTQVAVSDFNFIYISVQADVTLKAGISEGFYEQISDGINLFLSPWINSSQNQLSIHQEITETEVSNFICSFDEVEEVGSVEFKKFNSVVTTDKELEDNLVVFQRLAILPSELYVSAMKHSLTPKSYS